MIGSISSETVRITPHRDAAAQTVVAARFNVAAIDDDGRGVGAPVPL